MEPILDDWTKNALQRLGHASDDTPAFVPASHATASAETFYTGLSKTMNITSFLLKVTTFADNAGYVAKKIQDSAKDKNVKLPQGFDPFEQLGTKRGPFVEQFRLMSDTLFEMTLVRLSDAFTSYLSDVIRECLTKRHEILRSKETITFELALSCESMEELREVLVDRKVNELAYLGFPKLTEWMMERLGIDALEDFEALHAITRSIELRNCIVHNGSRASQRYASLKYRPDSLQRGQKVVVDVHTAYVAAAATIEAVKVIDMGLAAKFELQQRKLGARDRE